jgi:hypothetical protein
MERWLTDPRLVLAAVSALDLAVVLGLCWLVSRIRRERDAALAAQRATLTKLRADLGELVADAEARTRALDAQLAAREARLRALVRDVARAEERRVGGARDGGSDRAGSGRPRRTDPAEVRLRRDLEMAFGERGAV